MEGLAHYLWKGVIPPNRPPHHPQTVSPFQPPRPPPTAFPPLVRSVKQSLPAAVLVPPATRTSSSSSVSSAQIFYSESTTSAPTTSQKSSLDQTRGEDDQGFHGFDRFATTFTPKWLKEVPPPQRLYRHPTSAPFPLDSYTASIYPHSSEVPPALSHICPSILSNPPHQGAPRPLDSSKAQSDPIYYATHFSQLLSLHLHAQMVEADKAKVFCAPLLLHTVANHTFRLHIPGIREDIPRLNLKDRLVLRGLHPNHRVPSPTAIEAEVVGFAKAQGWVYVRSEALAGFDVTLPKTITKEGEAVSHYQITFAISAALVCAMQDAVRSMCQALLARQDLARIWLFPELADVGMAVPDDISVAWVDSALNVAQRAAVQAIANRHSSVPYLISGPPGTGKTKTLVESVLQILKYRTDAAVLVCAPSNTAADTVARRLGQILSPRELFRLNAPDRTFAEVADELLPFCHVSQESFDLPPFEQLMRFRVVVTGLQDAAILRAAKATNDDIMRAQAKMHGVFYPASPTPAYKPHWTHLLIDEAAQASEPENLIPISVILPPASITCAADPVVVLCGDLNQLGPIISSLEAREGELDVSLLERLFQREVYRSSPTPASTRPFTNLVQNYRSIAPILMVPSSMFYQDTLLPAAKDVSLIPWKGLPNRDIPILFQGCETEEAWIDEGASWFNTGEISVVVQTIQSLLQDVPYLKQKEIAVMSPWREQVWRIRARLRKVGLGGIDVGNVETYQGKEFRVTIISCVRSSARFLPEDRRTNMGLYNERRRFNVAITRAKELLVVIGNANLLKGDPYWNGFLQIMLRNGLYKGPKLDIEMTGAYISHIESVLQRNQPMKVEDAGLFLAGEMARTTLNEEWV